jgi:membrane associated rhomboid family serine protease
MKNQEGLIFRPNMLRVPVLFVFSIWLIYWIEIKFGFNFNKFGIFPDEWFGLRGILFSPFIHGDAKHLFNNSIPLFVLSLSLFYFYRNVANRVMILGTLFTGLLTWIIARESYHIGASGVIYMLFSFVFFSGVFKNHFRLIAVSLITIFLYGSMVWFLFPTEDRISWEGHLSGFLVGVVLAFLYRKRGIVKEEYQFSQTSFDLMFDENGNLIEQSEEEKINPNADE